MQNASSVLYKPTVGPKERALALAHKRRAEALCGHGEDRPIIKPTPASTQVIVQAPPSPPQSEAERIAEWVKRQRKLFPPLPAKPLWFSIEEEIIPEEPRRPKIEEIQRAVAESYAITRVELCSRRRHASVVRPRQVAMYLAKTMTHQSLPEIGRRFGGRDHTTVLHAVRKMDALRKRDQKLDAEIVKVENLIAGSMQ